MNKQVSRNWSAHLCSVAIMFAMLLSTGCSMFSSNAEEKPLLPAHEKPQQHAAQKPSSSIKLPENKNAAYQTAKRSKPQKKKATKKSATDTIPDAASVGL